MLAKPNARRKILRLYDTIRCRLDFLPKRAKPRYNEEDLNFSFMEFGTILTVIFGLFLFETVSSIDNAIINAEVLAKTGARAKRWFLTWGLFFAVFAVRGLLPWLIVWATVPSLGPWQAFMATLSSDPSVRLAIEQASPILLTGGGVFLMLLFLHWLFLEEKRYGFRHERFFQAQGIWFYALSSIFLLWVVWFTVKINPMIAFGAVVGSTAFFITHGFKQQAEQAEQKLLEGRSGTLSDVSKVLYLEMIDMTFSIDGVLGAFAFTLSVPLILIGNSLGALVVRQLTIGNIERIKKYVFLKNGAMYSIFVLGGVMLLEGMGHEIPVWVSPLATFLVVGYFFLRSHREL